MVRRVDLRPRPGGAESDPLRRRSISRTRSERHERTHAKLSRADAADRRVRAQRHGRSRRCDGETHPPGRRARTASTIPRLCYKAGMRPDGNCRACMVEINGERVLAPSCCRTPAAGHGGARPTASARCTSQKMVLELLLSDMPETRLHAGTRRARRSGRPQLDVGKPRFAARARSRRADLSHPAMAVNLDACIQCTRCVRACREEQVNDVIGYAFRGDAREDRVRPRRPDGRLDLRRLRRMRAGLPDRRADAGARRRLAVPSTSRSTRSARSAASAASSPTTSRTTRSCQRRRPRRPGQPRAPVRQGPLRLRLRAPPAAPDASR